MIQDDFLFSSFYINSLRILNFKDLVILATMKKYCLDKNLACKETYIQISMTEKT